MNTFTLIPKSIPVLVAVILLCFNPFEAQSQGVHLTGACDSLVICNENDTACFSFIELSPDYLDSCSKVILSYSLDLFSDGFIDETDTGAITGNLLYGIHEITWIVQDSCTTDSCVQVIDIQDCVAPNLQCFPGITTILGEVNEPWIFNTSDFMQDDVDNCFIGEDNTSWNLDSLINNVTISCSGSYLLTYYVIDNYGNYDSCNYDLFLDQGGYDTCFGVNISGNCDTLVICNEDDTGCFSYIELSPEYLDSCSAVVLSYSIDFFSDGFIDETDTGSIAGNYLYGMHEILWIVEDDCGLDSCRQVIDIQDCVSPDIPICFSGIITVLGEENQPWTFNASDFLQDDIDNCFLGEDNISWNLDSLINIETIGCPGSYTLTYYVIDNYGNYDSCHLNLFLDQGGDDSCFFEIRGIVQRPLSNELSEVRMSILDQFNNESNFDITENDGLYSIHNTDMLNSIKLQAFRDDEAHSGVTAYDLLLLNKVFASLIQLDPFQAVAADVNGSCSISALDLIEMKKLLLGEIDDWDDNTVWKFWDQSLDTSEFLCITSNTMEFELNADTTINWWAVKVGDINGAYMDSLWQNESENRSTTILNYSRDVKNMNSYNFNLNIEDIEAAQISLKIPESISIESVSYEDDAFDFNTLEDELRIVWTSVVPTEEKNLKFSILIHQEDPDKSAEFQLDESFKSLCYDKNGASQIEIREKTSVYISGVEKSNIFPNPISTNDILYLNTSEFNRVELYDIRGKLILLAENLTELHLDDSSILPGVYTIKIIENESTTKVHRLVVK